MLALPSLELARATRRHTPLICCRTNSLQVAAAAMQAAVLEKAPIMITIDATVATTLPHRALLASLLELGRESGVPVAVEVVLPATREAASWWISNGVLAITLYGTMDAIKRVLQHVSLEARAHGAEVGLEPTDLSTLREAEAFSERHEAVFVRVAAREKITEMHEYVKALRMPVIAAGMHLTPKKSRDLVAAGCLGLTLGDELHEAFTAGVRTGLRNRTAIDPARYLGYGATAVRELVRAHYHYFHP